MEGEVKDVEVQASIEELGVKHRKEAWWATYRAALPAAMAAFPKVSGGGSTSWHVTPWQAAHDRAVGQADLAHGVDTARAERVEAACQEARTAFLAGDIPRLDAALAALVSLARGVP